MISSAFRRTLRLLAASILCAGVASVASAATPTSQPRITAPIDNASRSPIGGSRSTRASAAKDIGVLPPDTLLQGITMVFSRSAAQQADLTGLIAAQQNPASPLYHQWLNPDQFAARFGMADADISKVQSWLQQQGFTLSGVSRSRDRITFSGTAAQVASAFGTTLHQYKTASGNAADIHFAPSTDLSIPTALSGIVATVGNISDFRLRPRAIIKNPKLRPNFTSSQSGNHFLTPGDVATIYDINAAYASGYTGSNQSIAVVGQSLIYKSDVANFQSAAGLPAKAPTMVLVPNSGAATVFDQFGDEAESDLDVEYSGAIAKGAQIFFVYTGNTVGYGVFDSLQYAVDEDISPIISISYGGCEPDLGSSYYATLDATLAQATAQGQSVIAASGDDGSTDCYEENGSTALAVDFPASSEYVTGVGGTEFPTADVAAGNNTYFSPANGSDVISSALSYIPEQAWNDSTSSGLASGGGGSSIFTPRPAWQAGVTGIPSGLYRLVPDIALDASPDNAGYLFCSSDTFSTGVSGSCSNGFRDAGNVDLTVAGGTSFAAPIFAGMLAILNQATNSVGQGVVNPTLYALAANSTQYALAFHDTTSGGNYCPSSICVAPSTEDYATTTGYDQATGLGSIDLNNLIENFPATATSSLVSTAVTLTPATTTPGLSIGDTIIIAVAPTAVAGTPTGTVTVRVDGVAGTPIALLNGETSYTFTATTLGSHVVVVTYSGDGIYAPSTASLALNVSAGGFTLSVPNITMGAGDGTTANISIASVNGYTGDLTFLLTAPANEFVGDICYSVNNSVPVNVPTTGTTAVLTIYSSSTACKAAGLVSRSGIHFLRSGGAHAAAILPARPSPLRSAPFGAGLLGTSLASLFSLGLFSKRARRLRKLQGMLAIAFLVFAGFGLSGCGYEGVVNPGSQGGGGLQPVGAYTLTLTGTDTLNAAITGSTTFTLTIQ